MTQLCPPSNIQLTGETWNLDAPDGAQDGFDANIHAVAADEQFIYATRYFARTGDGHVSRGPGELLVFGRDSLPQHRSVTVGFQPRSIAINPLRDRIYVLNYGKESYSLSVLRRSTLEPARPPIPIGLGLVNVAVNTLTDRVYVTNWIARRIHVIDSRNDSLLPPIELDPDGIGLAPYGIAVDEIDNVIYVTLTHQTVTPRINELAAIRLNGDAVARIDRVPIPPERSQPFTVAVSRALNRIYVGTLGVAGVAAPGVTVLDRQTLERIAVVNTGAGVTSVAVDPQTRQVFAAAGGGVQVIDAVSNTVAGKIALSRVVQHVAVDPRSGQVYTGDVADGLLHRVTPLAIDSPIGERWNELGGRLGAPLAGPRPTPDGQGLYQPFQQGAIFFSADYGATVLSRTLFAAWSELTQPAALATRAFQDDLGSPIGDSQTEAGDEIARFERGMIVSIAFFGAPLNLAISGPIYAHYQALGDVRSFLGLPIFNEEDAPNGGRRQRFTNGDIFWHPDSGAHVVYGEIRERWEALGGAGGALGFPTADEDGVLLEQSEIGRVSYFQGGAIYWKPELGAVAVVGQILRAWEQVHGGAAGALGFPVSDEQGSPHDPASPVRFTNFERGVIVWFPQDHPLAGPRKHFDTHAFRTMELFVERFVGDHNDGNGTGGEADLYVNHRLSASNGVEWNGRLPGSGDFGTHDKTVDLHIPITDRVQGDLVVSVGFTGRDNDSFPDPNGDDTIGVIEQRFSVDNLWGYKDNGVYSGSDDGTFTAFFKLVEQGQPFDPSKSFREQWWWRFDNFTTERLSKAQYAATFTDIDPGGIAFSFNPLDYVDEGWEALFYHLFYKHVADPGNCFGMSLEAIYAMRGRSLSSQPIHRYQRDATRINTINIKHGYQIGAAAIAWVIDQVVTNMTQDPVAVFERSRDAFWSGQYPVISLSKFFGGSAHTVLPVPDGWHEADNGNTLLISVADPKQPWRAGETDDTYQIRINRGQETFFFRSDDVKYEGGWLLTDPFGDRLFYTPLSVLAQPPQTPGLALGLALARRALIVVGDAGQTTQITDERGRTFYKPGLSGPPTRWEDLRYDDQRIRNMARIPLQGANGPGGTTPAELYAVEGNRSLRYEVVGTPGSHYRWAVRTPGTAAVLTVPGSATPDRIDATQLATARRSVAFGLGANASAKPIALLIEGQPGSARNKQFLVSELLVNPQQTITARIDNGGQELLITNDGPATSFRLQLRAEPGRAPTPAKQVALGAGKTARLRPADWRPGAIDAAPLLVEVRGAPDGPAEECFQL